MSEKETLQEKCDRLEKELEAYSTESTVVNSYFAMKKLVDDINKALSGGTIKLTSMSDKDDKLVERALKFADKLEYYNSQLDLLKKRLTPAKLDEVNKLESASIFEEVARENEVRKK